MSKCQILFRRFAIVACGFLLATLACRPSWAACPGYSSLYTNIIKLNVQNVGGSAAITHYIEIDVSAGTLADPCGCRSGGAQSMWLIRVEASPAEGAKQLFALATAAKAMGKKVRYVATGCHSTGYSNFSQLETEP